MKSTTLGKERYQGIVDPIDRPGRPRRGDGIDLNFRPTRYGSNRVDSPAPTETSRRRSESPPTGANPDVSRHSRLRIRVWDFFVPTGTEAKVTIRTERGVLLLSCTSRSVQSGRPKRSAPRSERSDSSFEVNTRGSRSSVVTVGPVRDGRRSYRSGSNMAGRAQSRSGPPAQRTHRGVAREPKGLS